MHFDVSDVISRLNTVQLRVQCHHSMRSRFHTWLVYIHLKHIYTFCYEVGMAESV